MKVVFKVIGMKNSKDITKIKNAITYNEGIIACQISQKKESVEIVYDNYLVEENDIIDCIEDLGYTIM